MQESNFITVSTNDCKCQQFRRVGCDENVALVPKKFQKDDSVEICKIYSKFL